ncbi:MAG: energy-coupling factor transporter transmembrane component T family protein [Candidatus Eiseniibacteriota bacterium]
MRFAFRRDVALGSYLPLPTAVHRLDPRTKLLLFAATLLVLFRVGPGGGAVLLLALAGTGALARLSWRRFARGLRALAWVFAITFLYQVLWTGRGHPSGLAGGTLVGLHMVLRLAAMLLAAYLLTFTTEPIRMADGLGRLFGFLERVRVPVRDLSLVLTLALRFLPTVMEEAERIVLAQQARGARFEGGPLARARRLLPLAVPLFAGCLHRAETLALAMEARGWRGGRHRTQLDPPRFAALDAFALVVAAAVVGLAFAVPGG